ncbi:glutaminase [Aeromicrobium alkaliterrae]|uniref:Glutaminase n=2 Tax=Aeromicrobium alkaliterrae TaxID=302168 RepID=A0ABP4VG69_9ACTN
MNDYLAELLEICGEDDGEVADYIPELATADPDRYAIAIATLDGQVYSAGDADVEFTIQSISKPFTYALAITDQGLDGVLEKIDVEPSGDAFNEISLEPSTGRPRNPMINAGAIEAHALVAGDDADGRSERIVELYSRLAGRELSVDEDVFESELSTADRNMAIAYMLKTVGTLDDDPAEVVRGYTRQCSVSVTVEDLARMASVLAANGVAADGTRVLETSVTRQVLSVMATCGMYDAAGDWLTTVGIPAKSGVAGGLIGVLPGQVGIAVFSPRLDEHGNSSRGVRAFERLSADMGLHLMEAPESARSVVRTPKSQEEGRPSVHEVAGDLRFIEAERVLRGLEGEPEGDGVVVIDLHRVHRIHDVARRMLLEGVRRLRMDGHEIRLVDPDGLLPDPDVDVSADGSGDQYTPEVFDDLDTALAP